MINGGKLPAFPVEDRLSNFLGITTRDYFAAKAMQGFAIDPRDCESLEQMAEWSYRWADAMLKEREK